MHVEAQLRDIQDKLAVMLAGQGRLEEVVRRAAFQHLIQGFKTMSALDTIVQEVQETRTAIDGLVASHAAIKAELANITATAKTVAEYDAKLAELSAALDAKQAEILAALATTPEGDEVEVGEPPVVE